jgi:hypothetical protein
MALFFAIVSLGYFKYPLVFEPNLYCHGKLLPFQFAAFQYSFHPFWRTYELGRGSTVSQIN